jgi:predicted site-specific integrase-resolvase
MAVPVPAPKPAPAPAQHAASDLLLPAQVADRLGVSTKVLERWRGTGDGPAFVRLTRKTLRYRAADVEAFINGKIHTSTAAG